MIQRLPPPTYRVPSATAADVYGPRFGYTSNQVGAGGTQQAVADVIDSELKHPLRAPGRILDKPAGVLLVLVVGLAIASLNNR